MFLGFEVFWVFRVRWVSYRVGCREFGVFLFVCVVVCFFCVCVFRVPCLIISVLCFVFGVLCTYFVPVFGVSCIVFRIW